jgi:hypothetical protein
MNTSLCCQRKPRVEEGVLRQNTLALTLDLSPPRRGRLREVGGWILPGALLALMPKCPICLAAYVALCTGFTMSYSSAHILMRTLTALCMGTLALCVIRRVVSFRHNGQTFTV